MFFFLIYKVLNRTFAKCESSDKEAQQVLLDANAVYEKGRLDRVLVYGRSSRRLLLLVLAKYSKGKYTPVTSRDMTKKERENYRKNLL